MALIGQLAATTPTEIIPPGNLRVVTLLFYNVHASDDQVVQVTLTRSGGTEYMLFRETLKIKEKFIVANFPLKVDDQIKAAATAAASVNYFVLDGTSEASLEAYALDSTGARKAGTVTGGLTFTSNLALPTIVAATGTAIPVTASGSLPITQAGAETNTLAIPTFLGQKITIFVDTDTSGARTITSAQRINQAGNTTILMTEVGDFIKLEAITIGGALRWQVVANEGCVLGP